LNFELLNGIDSRNDNQLGVTRVVVVHTVEQEEVKFFTSSVDIDRPLLRLKIASFDRGLDAWGE